MGSICGEELQKWEKTQVGLESDGERIRVAVRLRPLNEKEIARNDVSDWECINDTTIIYRHSLPERSQLPSVCAFDRVFRCECSTKQVYEEAAKEVALSVVSGINSSIFAYGQTSSGKTFTMSGITEHTVADIYEYIQKHEERVFTLKFSAIEIYNEAVKDLLSADGTPLRLLDDPERGTVVERLTEETLRDWDHLQELLAICEAQRQIGETNLNETSSRSHQILKLTIGSSAREFLSKENSSTLYASVNFVDLAGSERASQALSAGARLKEGCHINRSLLTLGTVIRKLSKGRGGHIPYRDSKLTRILQSSLGGNARTAIICTMSPARSHTEQSRNTLLFATCAKEVATIAQVNVVMSDKALVKHLQKELVRLEAELKGAGASKNISHSQASLREKDAQIQKMEKEIQELVQQRDLAQSRLEDLLQVVGDDEASRIWAGFNHSPYSHESLGAVNHSLDYGILKFGASKFSKEYSDADCNEDYLQLSEISEDPMLFNGFTPPVSIFSPSFIGSFPQKGGEEISQDVNSDAEDSCREVRCIEAEVSHATTRKEESNDVSLPEQVEMPLALTSSSTASEKDQESESTEETIEWQPVLLDSTLSAMDKQLYDAQKPIDSPAKPFSEESSQWPSTLDLSSFKGLRSIRSRSCRASLMASSYSSLFQPGEQNENTPPGGFERDFPGRPVNGGFQKRQRALSYANEAFSRDCSENSQLSASGELLKSQNSKSAAEENITSIRSFVKGLKEMAQLQYQRKLMDGKAEEGKATDGIQSEKTLKDVGLDPMQIPPESPSKWPMEFERLQREIIELWDACNVSLVHRTYFFLLFKGDPADSIYMEVELRRLSFLKNTFSQGNNAARAVEDGRIVTPASSAKALRREREMLSKHMQKKLSEEQRERLYNKWGIGLDTKQRRLQLARLLWTKTDDVDHIKESAEVVAKLVGFLAQGQALKEMFGLSFRPQWSNQRSQSWKHGGMASLL